MKGRSRRKRNLRMRITKTKKENNYRIIELEVNLELI